MKKKRGKKTQLDLKELEIKEIEEILIKLQVSLLAFTL